MTNRWNNEISEKVRELIRNGSITPSMTGKALKSLSITDTTNFGFLQPLKQESVTKKLKQLRDEVSSENTVPSTPNDTKRVILNAASIDGRSVFAFFFFLSQ